MKTTISHLGFTLLLTFLVTQLGAAPDTTLTNPITWSGGAGTSLWATGTNWSPSNTTWNATTNVLFDDTDAALNGKAIALGATRTIGSLEITSMADAFSITGNTLTLSSAGGSKLILSGAANVTIGSALTMGTDMEVNVGADAGDLTIAGNITGSSRKLTKIGDGTLILAGTNSYSGGTTLESGLLRLTGTHSGAGNVIINGGTYKLEGTYSGAGNFTLNTGGAYELAGNHTGGGTFTLADGTKINVTDDSTFAAATTGAGTIDINAGKTLSLSGSGKTIATAITGDGNLAKTGTGAVTLTGANTYTGTTTVEAGTLAMTNFAPINTSSSVTVNSGGTLSFTDNTTLDRSIYGTGSIAIANAKTLTLANANISDDITINPGITGGNTSTIVSKTGAGEVILAGQSTYAGNTNVTAGKLTLAAGSSNKSGTINISNGAELYIAGDASIGGNVTGAGAFNILDGSELTINNASNITFGKTIDGVDVSLLKTGAGNLTLNTSNTYTGDTTIRAGTLTLTNITNIANPDRIRLEGGILSLNVASGTLTRENAFLAGENGTIAGGLTKTGAGTLVLLADESYTGATTLSGGILEIRGTSQSSSISVASGTTLRLYDTNQLYGGITGTGSVQFINASDTLTFNTIAADSTQSAALDAAIKHIIKTGEKKLTFSTPLTNIQTFTLDQGTLTLSSTIPAGLQSITINDGLFQLSNAINDTYTINLNGGTLESLNGGTINQVLSGAGGLKMNKSAGTLTLNNVNTYTGATDVTSGTLVVTKENGISADSAINVAGTLTLQKSLTTNQAITGSGIVNITNAADTLTINNADNASSAVRIAGAGSLTKRDAGTLILSGAHSYTGATRVEDGLLELLSATGTNTAALTTSSIDVSSGATIRINKGTGSSNVAQAITGAGNFEKNGTGTIVFTNAKTYTGATTVAAGTLQLDTENAITADSALTVAGTLTLNKNLQTNQGIAGAGTVTLNGATTLLTINNATDAEDAITAKLTGTGAFTKTGEGKTTLAASNTFTGATNITQGTLELGNTGTLTGTSGVNISAGAGFAIDKTSGTLTFDRALTGAGSFTKTGAGIVAFSTAKTYTGATTINGGTLEIGTANAIAADSAISVASGATLSVKNDLTTKHAISDTGTVSIASGKIFTLNIDDAETMAATLIGGGGILTKNGTGTLTLTGNNTYTGVTNINTGTLELAGGTNNSSNLIIAADADLHITADSTITGSVSGNGLVAIDNDTRLTIANTAAQTISANITGGGGVSKTTSTALTLSGTNDYKGGTISAGNITVTGDNTAADGGWTLTSGTSTISGGTIGLAAGKSIDIQGGTLTLTNGGTIKLNAAPTGSIISTTGTFTLGTGGGIIDTNGFDTTIDRIIAGSGSFTKNGAGILTLAGNNTYTGVTNINAGTLELTGTNRSSGYNIDRDAVLRFSTDTTVANGFSGGANGIGSVEIAGANTILTIDRRTASTTTSIDTAITGDGTLKILTRNDWYDAFSSDPYRTTTTLTAPTAHKGGTIVAGGTALVQPTSATRIALVVQGDQSAADGGWFINPAHRTSGEFMGANVVFDVGSKIVVGTDNPDTQKITLGNVTNGDSGTNNTHASVLHANGYVDNGGDLILGYFSRIYMARDATAAIATGDGWNNGTGSESIWIQRGNLTILNVDTRSDASLYTGSGIFLKNGATFDYRGTEAMKLDARGAFNPYLDYGATGLPKPNMSHAVFNQEWERSKLTQATFMLDQGSTLKTSQGIEMANRAFMTIDGGKIVLTADVDHLISTTGTVKDIFVGRNGFVVDTNGFSTAIDMSFDYIDNGQTSGVSYDPSSPRGGSGALTKLGEGTLTLTKNIGMTAIGKLDVQAGTLELNGTDGFAGYVYDALNPGNAYVTRMITIAKDATLLVSGDTNANISNISGEGLLAKTGNGTLTLNGNNTSTGGTKINAGTVQIDTYARLGSGDLHFTGDSTLKMTMTTPGTFTKTTTIDAGVTATFDVANRNQTLAAQLNGTGTLQKTGTGLLTLNGLTGTAGIRASAGQVVIVDASNFTGTLTIDNAATAYGTGPYGGDITVSGTLVVAADAFGATIGTLHIDGNLTLNTNATLLFNLGDGTGVNYSHLEASSITIAGATPTLTLLSNGFDATMAERFDLLSGTLTDTNFSLMVNDTLLTANNQGTTINLGGQNYYLESLGHGISLVAATAIPEPATIGLCLGAIALAGVLYRRRHHRKAI
ncbi:autotransporter-associated beta strand repeat-containing protein [Geminisphaera colitermitum]|uniref:autotransporter-associated beta strand repeat-containing protein n=1 Tax=Geminisphaera colitermitum TaxID=1148786 RepID=UPI0002E63CEA|nr:autotransporter-associated beta strand repeat-containing protein [Geminisphaera colitermitum]